MARTQISEEFGKSSLFDHRVPANVQSSMVQLGRKTTTTIDIGMLHPVDLFEVLPGDYVNLSWRYILDSLPLASTPYTPFRVRFHVYYDKYLDLWAGASTYLTKGRNGNMSLTKPTVQLPVGGLFDEWTGTKGVAGGPTTALNAPMSLSSLLGVPSAYYSDPSSPQYRPYTNTSGHREFEPGSNLKFTPINALPFMMYQKIYRRHYMPSNLLQDSKIWFPDDLTEPWRISYSKDNLDERNLIIPGSTSFNYTSYVPSVTDNTLNIMDVRYACYGDDTFTTALPFQVRGTPPSMSYPISIPEQILPLINTGEGKFSGFLAHNSELYANLAPNPTDPSGTGTTRLQLNISGGNSYYLSPDGTEENLTDRYPFVNTSFNFDSSLDSQLRAKYGAQLSAQTIGTSVFDLNSLRQLMALSVWQERNTRTNGNYNSLIYAHFGDNPDYDDFEPRYLGGSSDVVYFNEVVQTSESSGSNPLGSVGGLGHADKTSEGIQFSVPDYGYIMIIANIMPDVSYTQGLERLFSRVNQEDEYFPEYNALGFQAILNKEIYLSGDTAQDNDVFGWQERNLDYKIRRSRATGLFALPPVGSGQTTDALFSSYVMNRYFNSLPKLSAQFVTASPDNIRRDWLAYPNLPAFKMDFATDVSVRRNIPYQNVPETFGF